MPGTMTAPRIDPATRVQFLTGVGPKRALLFERLGLHTLEQLVRHYPRTYLDARRFVAVKDLQSPELIGELVTVTGTIRNAAALRTRGGRTDFAATVHDGTGALACYFFGQPFLARTLKPGARVVVSGELDPRDQRMLNPLFEVVEGEIETLLHAGRLVPVHALTRGITGRGMRQAIQRALEQVADQVEDPVPAEIVASRRLPSLGEALRQIHFPDDDARLEAGRRRLAFEEIFLLQSVLELRRRVLAEEGRGLATAGG